MKKTLLHSLVVCSFLAIGTLASAATKLQVKAYNNTPITLTIDGKEYGPLSNTQTIENLPAGNHKMQVTASVQGRGTATGRQTIYSGNISLKDGFSVNAMVTQSHQLQITSQVSLSEYPTMKPMSIKQAVQTTQTNSQGHGDNNDRGGRDDNHGGQNNHNDHDGHGGYGDHDNRNSHSDWDHDQHGGGYYPPQPMCQADFQALLHTIDSKSFESTKLDIAKQALSTQYVTSDQVKVLLGLFWFDSSKLDLAKYAYTHTLDPQRYFVVNDAFTFESSISSLINYINSQNTYAYNR